MNCFSALRGAIAGGVLIACWATGAQTGQRSAKASDSVPRARNGKPDLTGVWQPASDRRGTWEEANTGTGLGETGGAPAAPAVKVQPMEPPPYQPWAAAKVVEYFNRRGIDDPMARCVPEGVPRITSFALFPMQIVQTETQIVILYEFFNSFRIIPLNAKHPDELDATYLGDSVGHWEGDTLVVDVAGFNDKTWLGYGVGTFHSEALHVVERYTRINRDAILYDATVEDPMVFTKPWVIHSSIMLRPGTRIHEFECSNNVDLKRYDDLLKDDAVFRRKPQ